MAEARNLDSLARELLEKYDGNRDKVEEKLLQEVRRDPDLINDDMLKYLIHEKVREIVRGSRKTLSSLPVKGVSGETAAAAQRANTAFKAAMEKKQSGVEGIKLWTDSVWVGNKTLSQLTRPELINLAQDHEDQESHHAQRKNVYRRLAKMLPDDHTPVSFLLQKDVDSLRKLWK